MRIVSESLFRHPGFPGMILVTTNGVLKRDGSLVMGRGSALDAVRHIPGIQFDCGRAVARSPWDATHTYHEYGLIILRQPSLDRIGFGLFQTKGDWVNPGIMSLIQLATDKLIKYLSLHPTVSVRMPLAGCGNSWLKPADIIPVLDALPDTVTICRQ